MDYVLGVDGGNTKTIALVARRDGVIVGAGRAGCGDMYATGSVAGALAQVTTAVSTALDGAGIAPTELAVGAFSMAGADWPEDFALLQGAMTQRGFGRRVIVVNDALGALRAGTVDGMGVVVVCGTGAATGARAPDGRTWHTSHWQEPQGALHLAHKTLRAVYRADLGTDPPTALTPAVLRYFGLDRVEEVLHRCTARAGPHPAQLDRLAPILLDVAAAGDPTARRIVVEHGAALGDDALAAIRQVGLLDSSFPLILTGGVLRHPAPLLAEAIAARVQQAAPGAHPRASRFEPAVGAIFLALEASGARIDEPCLARLIPTLPPATLFATGLMDAQPGSSE